MTILRSPRQMESNRGLMLATAAMLFLSQTTTTAFHTSSRHYRSRSRISASPPSTLSMASDDHCSPDSKRSGAGDSTLLVDRRQWFLQGAAAVASAILLPAGPANAQIFLDPAMYGDQELRVSAVDTVRESVRRSILQNPQLAPSFYQLAMIDALSYDAKSAMPILADSWQMERPARQHHHHCCR
jgi:hypothetical protein